MASVMEYLVQSRRLNRASVDERTYIGSTGHEGMNARCSSRANHSAKPSNYLAQPKATKAASYDI